MSSDKKIEMIKEIVNDNKESADTIIGPVRYGNQSIEFTKAGRLHVDKMFNNGNLQNPLKDCTITVKIEDYKAQISVVHEGVTILEFEPVDPKFTSSTFEFTGISMPLTLGW